VAGASASTRPAPAPGPLATPGTGPCAPSSGKPGINHPGLPRRATRGLRRARGFPDQLREAGSRPAGPTDDGDSPGTGSPTAVDDFDPSPSPGQERPA
jgi:hypothetical protein